jgi:hypothetical protein
MSAKRTYSRWARLRLVAAIAVGLLAFPAVAEAGPRDDVRNAYATAKEQFNNLDLDAALAGLDAAVSRAEGAGLANDPTLGPVHILRGGIIFSNSGNRAQTLAAFKQAIACDWNSALPIELRSPDVQKILDEARRGTPRPSNEAFVHTPPTYARGADVEFTAQANVTIPDGGQIVLYWKKAGDSAEFVGESMVTFGNFGTFVLPAAKHGDAPLQYFLYAFDASGQQTLANRGDKERPMLLEPSGDAAVVAGGGTGDPTQPEGEGEEPGKPGKPKKPPGKSKLPRVFINLGFGTGLGIARGTADLTYQQFTPGPGSSTYLVREQACAIERWFAADGSLAPDQVTFGSNLATISGIAGVVPEGTDAAALTAAYDADFCGQRHPVTTGLASAPFHLAPEIGVRVGKRIVLSLFTRLQFVVGSKVFTEDPDKLASDSFIEDVRSANPEGARRRPAAGFGTGAGKVIPGFSYAIGMKFKYFFGNEDKKLRVYAGVLAGAGAARLRVNMGFSNDRNGNSVPDAIEIAYSGPADPLTGEVDVANCTNVWPYTIGCDPTNESDRVLAGSVSANTPATDTRIDTVRIGSGFVGGLVGVHYQIIKNLGLFAELDVMVWFPKTTSALFDITLGPVITF